MNAEYSVQHEEADLAADITKNYELYMDSPQERHPADHPRPSMRGQLIDPVAQTYEKRMNRSLESYRDLSAFAGRLAGKA